MRDDEEAVRFTQEALSLALAAVQCDETNDYPQAIDLYAQATLSIDEVLSCLDNTSEEAASLLLKRETYENRMETLREIAEGAGLALFTPQPDAESKPLSPPSSSVAKRRQTLASFKEMDTARVAQLQQEFELPPKSLVAIPYWQLRVIGRTIRGGLLTPSLLIPPEVWTQHPLRFSGLSVKSAAFQDIISTVKTIESLTMPPINDPHGRDMQHFINVLASSHRDLIALQNQLARSFSFVPEVNVRKEGQDGSGDQSHGDAAGDSVDAHEVTPSPSPSESSVESKARSIGASLLSSGSISMSRFTSLVSSVGKTVRKTLEIGVSRYNALPSSVSEADFAAFAALVESLCTKSQALEEWYRRLDVTRDALVNGALKSTCDPGSEAEGAVADISEPKKGEGLDEAVVTQRISDIESALTSLLEIAAFFRDVVCELLLRDIDLLLERYLSKMRKSFAKMNWEAEGGGGLFE